jgi:hypothetical protein
MPIGCASIKNRAPGSINRLHESQRVVQSNCRPQILRKSDWVRHLSGKNSHQMAQQVIGNLVGYRSTSLHKADDLDQMTMALEAVRELTILDEKKNGNA